MPILHDDYFRGEEVEGTSNVTFDKQTQRIGTADPGQYSLYPPRAILSSRLGQDLASALQAQSRVVTQERTHTRALRTYGAHESSHNSTTVVRLSFAYCAGWR